MPYFPKSQIKTNLYTDGNEFCIINTTNIYKGYYYKTSNGKYYSGKSPSTTNPTFEIIPINQSPLFSINSFSDIPAYQTDNNPSTYTSYPNQFLATSYPKFIPGTTKIIPYYNPLYPTPQDYQIGEFRRYFCKKTNEIKYIEIDKKIYDLLISKSPTIEYSLYLPFYLDWQLTGNIEQVARTNKNNAELTVQKLKLPGLLEYLRLDFTKYYK